MIEDIFDNYYDAYLDNLQDSVDAYYTCSECGKECLPVVEDDSFGYDYGSIKSTHKQQTVYSDCCNANAGYRDWEIMQIQKNITVDQ